MTLLRLAIVFFGTSHNQLGHASQCTIEIKPWTLYLHPACISDGDVEYVRGVVHSTSASHGSVIQHSFKMEAHRLYPVWNGRVLEVLIRRLDLDGSGAGA
jgi:hypothetical protein